jgi:hypothetical protein
MTNGQLLTIILSLGIPMLTGFGWMIRIIFQSQKEMTLEMSSMRSELLKEIRVLDARISHIEGYLIGSTQRTGTKT